jgi:hypothetical protein
MKEKLKPFTTRKNKGNFQHGKKGEREEGRKEGRKEGKKKERKKQNSFLKLHWGTPKSLEPASEDRWKQRQPEPQSKKKKKEKKTFYQGKALNSIPSTKKKKILPSQPMENSHLYQRMLGSAAGAQTTLGSVHCLWFFCPCMLQSLLPHPECSLCCFLIGII